MLGRHLNDQNAFADHPGASASKVHTPHDGLDAVASSFVIVAVAIPAITSERSVGPDPLDYWVGNGDAAAS